MGVHKFFIDRDLAEFLVDLIEYNYTHTKDLIPHSGTGADFASELRDAFGMMEQPDLSALRVANLKEQP
jgi:hypothetical protein